MRDAHIDEAEIFAKNVANASGRTLYLTGQPEPLSEEPGGAPA